MFEYPVDPTKDQVKEYLLKFCKESPEKEWNRRFCEQISSPSCAEGCHATYVVGCSGVLVEGGYFVTAMHCSEGNGPRHVPRAAFMGTDGNVFEVNLKPTRFSVHRERFDLSIYQIQDSRLPAGVGLRTDDPRDAEPVFAIGFPTIKGRKSKAADYSVPHNDPRLTFGRVVYPNIKHESYCVFSNDVGSAKPETWRFEPDCTKTPYDFLPYEAREQKDPFLTSSDMTYGMSGSPLFDAKGRLLGIGTTILNSEPGDYHPENHAVYVKSSNLARLLGQLNQASQRLKLDEVPRKLQKVETNSDFDTSK